MRLLDSVSNIFAVKVVRMLPDKRMNDAKLRTRDMFEQSDNVARAHGTTSIYTAICSAGVARWFPLYRDVYGETKGMHTTLVHTHIRSASSIVELMYMQIVPLCTYI